MPLQIISFDSRGVTLHPNHIALSDATRYFAAETKCKLLQNFDLGNFGAVSHFLFKAIHRLSLAGNPFVLHKYKKLTE